MQDEIVVELMVADCSTRPVQHVKALVVSSITGELCCCHAVL